MTWLAQWSSMYFSQGATQPGSLTCEMGMSRWPRCGESFRNQMRSTQQEKMLEKHYAKLPEQLEVSRWVTW